MKLKKSRNTAFALLGFFVLFTIIVACVDVRVVGPFDKSVGLAGINTAVRDFLGRDDTMYKFSSVIGYISFALAGFFAGFGIYQLISRKSLKKIDSDIIVLGGTYVVTAILYVLFDILAINYRPVDLGEGAEPSFPSSHAFLVAVILITAIDQIKRRIKNNVLQGILIFVCIAFTMLTSVARLMSGVHWITDIVGGVILGCGIAALYKWIVIMVLQNRSGSKE